MTRFKAYTILFINLILVSVFACNKPKDDEEVTPTEFDKEQMLTSVAEKVILPQHKTFAEEASTLSTLLSGLNTSVDANKIAAAQAQWNKCAEIWGGCELFNIGEVMDVYIHNKIYTWPANTGFIDGFITGTEVLNEAFIDSKGSSSKGLPAIEYLLFNDAGVQAVVDSLTSSTDAQRRLQYLIATGQNLAKVSNELYNIWSPEGSDYKSRFIAATRNGFSGSVNLLVNEMANLTEKMAGTKIGRPLGKTTDNQPHLDLLQAYRSQQSLAILKSNLHSLELAFHGAPDNSGTGIDTYLDFVGAKYDDMTLSDKVDAQFTIVEKALDDISPSLETTLPVNMPVVDNAYQELKALLVLFKVDVASNLSITLTINDNDGD